MINIVIVCMDETDRNAIRALLAKQDDFRIIRSGKDAYDALTLTKSHQPNIIIMDLKMGDYHSPDLAPIIKRISPSTSIIALDSHGRPDTVVQALKAGISGYLLRQEGFESLAASIRSVFYGGLYISESIKNYAWSCFFIPADAIPAGAAIHKDSLSPTESGIFYRIACGFTDWEIAGDLNMNRASVRNSVNHVKKRTGLKNRTQIAIHALIAGAISLRKIRDAFLETV